jgi:hypothetical protein
MYVFIGEPKFSSIGYKVGARFRLSYKYIHIRSLIITAHDKKKPENVMFIFLFAYFSGRRILGAVEPGTKHNIFSPSCLKNKDG